MHFGRSDIGPSNTLELCVCRCRRQMPQRIRVGMANGSIDRGENVRERPLRDGAKALHIDGANGHAQRASGSQLRSEMEPSVRRERRVGCEESARLSREGFVELEE